MLTIGKDKTFIQCELFEETIRLKPNHLIVLTHEDGTAKWYVLGEPIHDENKWIVPLQVVEEADEAEARRTGYIAHFVVGKDARLLSES
jgi:hypothetical protein